MARNVSEIDLVDHSETFEKFVVQILTILFQKNEIAIHDLARTKSENR